MPRINVIVLDKVGPLQYRYAMWADVPASRQRFYASTGAGSAWKDATSGDIANLQSGAVVEKVDVYNVLSTDNVASVESILQLTWQSFQSGVTNANPWVFYGTTLSSGLVWTTTGVA